jgi:hypothetical protein
MNIESKHYKVRSTDIAGQAEIIAKSTGRAHYCPLSRLPSTHALAMMHEREFDAIMCKEMS